MLTKEERAELDTIRDRLWEMELKVDRVLTIVKGIAIGIAIGGVVFGFVTVKDLLSMAK